jgi:hypothetical protein
MELQIYSPSEDGFIKEISWNHEEIKKEVAEKVSFYADLVYTDDQIKTAKEDRAKLRKFVDALESKRKEIKKQCLSPYEAFEKQMKEIIEIVNKPILMIDGQVKEFEENKKAEKLEAIKEYFNSFPLIGGFESLKFEQIFDPKWLNASVSMKSVEETISNKLNQIVTDLATLAELPEFGFEATEVYKDTLDITKAIAEGRRLSEMQKRKAEAERLRAEQEAKQEITTVCPPEEIPAVNPEAVENIPQKQWVLFSALLSTEDALALKDFFNSRNIEFKAVKR